MAHLIDKDALVAEIERRLGELSKLQKKSYEIGLYDAYKIVLSFLDTLEVKEVEAEKDLELTWEDIYVILYSEREVLRAFGEEEHTNEEICIEVLKRFKEKNK